MAPMLLMEGEPRIRDTAWGMLDMHGHRVITANDDAELGCNKSAGIIDALARLTAA